jgi:hypothetical protein
VGGRGIHPKWPIPRVLAQYRLRMQTTRGGGGGSVWAEVDMHIEVVGGPVDEIEWRGGYSPQMANPARTRSISPAHANSWRWWLM